MYDLLIKNGRVIDPVNGVDGTKDIAIDDRRIVRVEEDIPSFSASEVLDVCGKTVIPGLVDIHTHLSPSTSRYSHRMLALAGVTAALDMSGPIDGVLRLAREEGAGLTVASIEALVPGANIPGLAPDSKDIEKALDEALDKGSLGIKLLAAAYLLEPDSIGNAFRIANERRAYVAAHCGSSKTNSDIRGFLEAVELAGSNRVHMAHVNSYCRGLIRPDAEETEEAVRALIDHPWLRSESYMSQMNGNSAGCENGIPKTPVTKNCLRLGGYPETQEGLRQAILDGWANINIAAGGQNMLINGPEAVERWLAAGTDTGVSFPVNPPLPRYRLATAKRPDGSFVCDALSTDGGGIPRNVLVSHGLSLIRFGALSWNEYVYKTSTAPAKILGLPDHGSLTAGLLANITVVDPEKQIPVLAVSNGRLIMIGGHVCGAGSRFVTTERGERNVRENGLEPLVIHLEETGFYRGL